MVDYKCHLCVEEDTFLADLAKLKSHLAVVHKLKVFVKVECFRDNDCATKFYDTEEELIQHLITDHKLKLRFQCPHCNKKCTQKGNLKSHIKSMHSVRRPDDCPNCNEPFRPENTFKIWM